MKQFIPIVLTILAFIVPISAQDSKENADFKLAVNLYNDKLYDLALEQFHAFINLYPNTAQGVEARFYLGLTQSRLGKHDDARFTFQNFALAYTDNIKAPEAWMNVAEEYVAMGNIREAAMAFERVKTFHPKSKFAPSALLKAAEYYEKLDDGENAHRVLRTLTQEYTTGEVLPARIKLAEMFLACGQLEQARQESKRVADATKDTPMKARALLLMGQSLLAFGKPSEAEEPLNDIIKNYSSTPSYYSALYTIGMLKNSSGNTEDAMTSWRSLAEDSIKAPAQLRQDAYMEMGEANNRVREWKRALVLFEHASDIKGTRHSEALYKAGVAAERAGDLTKAAKYYSNALSDSIGFENSRALIIGAYKAAKITKNYTEAIRLVVLYQTKFSADALLPKLLSEGATIALNNWGSPEKAVEFCSILIGGSENNRYIDEAFYTMGLAKRKIGDIEGAISTFELLQKRYPSSEFVMEAQKQIRLINAFDQRDKSNSIQKLALLVGDVIAQKSQGNLSYRLAEIYFHDLKDYQLAAEQYARALSVDLEDELRPRAWFNQAQSYELLALKEGEKKEKGITYLNKAIALYDSLTVRYPSQELSDQATISAFTLRIKLAEKSEDLRKLGTEFLSKSSNPRGKDVALLALGNSYLLVKNYEDAILTYKLLLEKYSDRETAPTALFQLGMALDGMMEKDSAVKVLEQFVLKNPNHLNSAAAAAYLAKSAADSGQLSKAISYIDLIEKRYFYSPFNSSLERKRADAYYRISDYTNAVSWYQRALEKLRTDFFNVAVDTEVERLIIYRLGECYEQLGNSNKAKKWYADYITRDQSSERAGKAYYALAKMAKADNIIDLATKYLQDNVLSWALRPLYTLALSGILL